MANEKDKLMVWLREHTETKPLRLTELMSEKMLTYADTIDRLRFLDKTKLLAANEKFKAAVEAQDNSAQTSPAPKHDFWFDSCGAGKGGLWACRNCDLSVCSPPWTKGKASEYYDDPKNNQTCAGDRQ